MKQISSLQMTIASAPTLNLGDKHPAIKSIKKFLGRFGYLDSNNINDLLDKSTSAALTEYQRFSHLPQTGILDTQTRDLMSKPRCGHPDPTGAVAFKINCPWDRLELTFAFDSGTNDIPGKGEHEAVRNALRTWAATGYFLFREVKPKDNPHILIGWRTSDDPDGGLVDGAWAHGDYPPGCSVYSSLGSSLPLHFNDEHVNWAIGGLLIYAIDVETVALHEIGHCLGLQHSSVDGSIMNYTTILYRDHHFLGSDDLAALEALYGSKNARQLANTVIIRVRQHFGNERDYLPGVFAGQSKDFVFDCPGIDVADEAILTFQARDIDNERNILLINKQAIAGGISITARDKPWTSQTLLINSGVLKPKDNQLHIESRSGNGTTSGDLDDFVIDNVTVWYPVLERGRVIPLTPGSIISDGIPLPDNAPVVN